MVYIVDDPVDPPLGWWIYWEKGVGILRMSLDGDNHSMSAIADIDHVSTHATMVSAVAEVIANTREETV